jgi:subtilase family serine protease
MFLVAPAILVASVSVAAGAATAFRPLPLGAPVFSAPSSQPAHFAITFPLRNRPELDALLAAQQDPSSPIYHHWLTRDQFAQGFGPSLASRILVARELQAAGFSVDLGSQGVFAHGSQTAAERYFHTRFALRTPDGNARSVLTPMLPLQRSALVSSQQGHVIGLDGLPDFHSNAVFERNDRRLPDSYYGAAGPYFAPDLKQAYSYPSYALATGAGTTIGIISSSPVSSSDISEYFTYSGDFAPGNKVPSVTEFPIGGGGAYSASGAATGEVTLDVEMAGGSAPGAAIGIFNTPDLSSGNLLEAYSVAVEAGTDIVSSSIGGCEKAYDNQVGIWVLKGLDNVFAEGSSEGVTFVGASGDNAAFECGSGTATANLSVQTPTDDPIMLAVGGTTDLVTTHVTDSDNSAYVSESSYDSTFTGHGGSLWGSCGGYSVIFEKPAYQKAFQSSNTRGVPDVAMHMGGPATSNSGDEIYVGGQFETVFGTSAAAPEFAGLLALRAQLQKGKLGDVHSFLYNGTLSSTMFHRGIPGTNGGYVTNTLHWDAVLGLGTPYGRVVAGVPTGALAGIPFTASNP